MHRLVRTIFFLVGIFFVWIPKAWAFTLFDSTTLTKIKTTTGLGDKKAPEVAVGIINTILQLLGLITVALIIYGGLMYMLAQGNEEKLSKARGILKGAFIGLLVVLSAYGIASYVFSIISSSTTAAAAT